MNVELIAYTQPVSTNEDRNPMAIVEQAACVCYDSEPTNIYRIAKGCKNTGHLSTYEHISFTFKISGVSRALLAQLTRHRHCSFSVRSQRYNNESNFDYVNPFYEIDHEYFDRIMGEISSMYDTLQKRGAKNEDARAVLPNACCTELVFTINGRSLIEISRLRLCSRAQAEIRELFKAIRKEVDCVCPELASYMVPSCEADKKHPFCTEHNSCGRHPKLADVYNVNK